MNVAVGNWATLMMRRKVRSPVAEAEMVPPSAGTCLKSIGAVSVNVAVGNWATLMMRPLNWPSRRLSSLLNVVMSTVKEAAVAVLPCSVSEPVTALVRPLASVAKPLMLSFTR